MGVSLEWQKKSPSPGAYVAEAARRVCTVCPSRSPRLPPCPSPSQVPGAEPRIEPSFPSCLLICGMESPPGNFNFYGEGPVPCLSGGLSGGQFSLVPDEVLGAKERGHHLLKLAGAKPDLKPHSGKSGSSTFTWTGSSARSWVLGPGPGSWLRLREGAACWKWQVATAGGTCWSASLPGLASGCRRPWFSVGPRRVA